MNPLTINPDGHRGSTRRASPGAFFVLLAAIFALGVFLFPLLLMVSTSFKTLDETRNPLQLLPHGVQWGNYAEALHRMDFWNALANTITVAALATAGTVLTSSLVGFGFAKFRFPGRDVLFYVMLATMMLPPQVTMIPVFILFRHLGLVDTLLSLIVPSWFGVPYFIYMFRQFFTSIPDELLESARVDGAGLFTTYVRVLMPMSWPVIAVVSVFSFIGAWNDYLGPLIYLNSARQYTLGISHANLTGQYGSTNANLLMAASVLTMIPCVLAFFWAQRLLVESDIASGVKG